MLHSCGMKGLIDARVVLRWGYLSLGIFLLVRSDVVLNSALAIRPLLEVLFPFDPRRQNLVLAMALILILPAALLCLASSWGLSRGRKWARWTGVAGCLCLLPGVPWFTLIGLTGAVVTLLIPLKAQTLGQALVTAQSKDYWTAARNSRAQTVVVLLAGPLFIAVLDSTIWLGRRLGLPEPSEGFWAWRWWLYLLPLALANAAIHEFGHVFMAWALHQRIKIISIGPFTFSMSNYGKS